LSDCSGSTTGKMEVRVLTHSQAVSSACERRESIACARKGSLRLLLCPGVRARARGENARRLARASSSPRLPSRSEQKRFTGCVMTEECPCSPREATLGASPRRRAAAGRGFFHPPAGTEADGGGAWRGAAARTRTHLFLRGRVPRERAGASRSRRSFGICSSEKKVRRRRSDARAEPLTAHEKKKQKKKRPLRVYDDGAERVSRSSRSGQKRIIGCVMTEECPCSPREATLGASPRRRTAAGRAYVSIIPRRFEKQTVAAPFEVHLHGGLRDPGEEHPLNVALSQNAPRLRVFYVRFCR
jgi:hypothetical protein